MSGQLLAANLDRCCGFGACVEAVPAIFTLLPLRPFIARRTRFDELAALSA